ncbi:hypothetical protein NP493_113g03034 [Ridgeia piscesae]|uniref:TOG domain-containing protein n=1 Tax=Ridgeia piscesae TaxID=27915 RepID=A0AAD9P6U3_RIDPI|nr:hypothetical protein NP493_113g03034 [Ridgeia piscesae]
MADPEEHVVENILRNITRFINGLSDENRNTRKRSLEGIRKEILSRKPQLEPTDLQQALKEIVKPLLQVLSDPVEKCRDLSLCFMADCLQVVPEPYNFLSFIIPVVVQRLGQQDIVEPSEELRLSLVKLLLLLVESCKKKMGPYVDDMVKILQRTIIDPYPEVKKESCHCASALAKAVPEFFHMQSETLIKPLLMSISHQHSRVRVDVIKTIGDVIQYGNGKSVDDVVSHLAQRLFDTSPMVRAGVIQVVGQWLLDLPDRYSFHYKLIPLLLSGITDEVAEIRAQADALWNDVGVKYESENEKDLKDLQDFPPPDPDHYPPGVEPPNLGCRKLVYHNFSKIVPGIVNDITDWVAPTRIKSAHLLYTLMLDEGDNVTQHLEKVLGGLYRAAMDDEQEVVKYVEKSAELIGYFVSPKVWCKMILDGVRLTQSVGSLIVLAAIIRGSRQADMKSHLDDIVGVITEPSLCRVADASLQYHLLACVESLTLVSKDDCTDISLSLFSLLITVLALHRADIVKDQVHKLLVKLAEVQHLEGVQDLYSAHTRVVWPD